jgi:hypothetical protein
MGGGNAAQRRQSVQNQCDGSMAQCVWTTLVVAADRAARKWRWYAVSLAWGVKPMKKKKNKQGDWKVRIRPFLSHRTK